MAIVSLDSSFISSSFAIVGSSSSSGKRKVENVVQSYVRETLSLHSLPPSVVDLVNRYSAPDPKIPPLLPQNPELTCDLSSLASRAVYTVPAANIVMKVTRASGPLTKDNELLAFAISEYMCLEVVPPITVYEDAAAEELLEQFPSLAKPLRAFRAHCVTVDEVEAEEYFLFLQPYIPPTGHRLEVDLEAAHRAVVFHWIAGTNDVPRGNSVVDREGKVWEIDSELLGDPIFNIATHWLIDPLAHPGATRILTSVISETLVIKVLQAKEEDIASFCADTQVTLVLPHIQKNIGCLQQAIRDLRSLERPLSCEQLLERSRALSLKWAS